MIRILPTKGIMPTDRSTPTGPTGNAEPPERPGHPLMYAPKNPGPHNHKKRNSGKQKYDSRQRRKAVKYLTPHLNAPKNLILTSPPNRITWKLESKLKPLDRPELLHASPRGSSTH